jgi:hypothetical protein
VLRFEHALGVQIVSRALLVKPPISDGIPFMWAQLSYRLQPRRRKTPDGARMTLSYDTICQLRSAASQYMAWDMMVRHPGQVYLDQGKRVIQQACRPTTDSLGATMFASGMKARLGDESRPSVALLDRHVRWLDADLVDQRYIGGRERMQSGMSWQKLVWLIFLLCGLDGFGRLRLSVFNGTRWFRPVEAADDPSVNLPYGVGAVIQYLMGPETKSNHSQTAQM